MPLTTGQINAITMFIRGDGTPGQNTLNSGVNQLCEAREDLCALLRIHNAPINDAGCGNVLTGAKAKLNDALADLTTLIGALP